MTGAIKILLEKGADREVRDFTERTALEWADKEDVRELLQGPSEVEEVEEVEEV